MFSFLKILQLHVKVREAKVGVAGLVQGVDENLMMQGQKNISVHVIASFAKFVYTCTSSISLRLPFLALRAEKMQILSQDEALDNNYSNIFFSLNLKQVLKVSATDLTMYL